MTGCAGQRYHTSVAAGASDLPRGADAFGWPLDGRVMFPYGAREDGVSLKGVVLQGSEGQEVRASAQGRVVYVDDSLRGYGKTVVLEHAQGFSTVYARASQILVDVGASVHKGQAVARVGRAGKGSLPQIYFEVRRNTKPMDPELVLK